MRGKARVSRDIRCRWFTNTHTHTLAGRHRDGLDFRLDVFLHRLLLLLSSSPPSISSSSFMIDWLLLAGQQQLSSPPPPPPPPPSPSSSSHSTQISFIAQEIYQINYKIISRRALQRPRGGGGGCWWGGLIIIIIRRGSNASRKTAFFCRLCCSRQFGVNIYM